ncbi:rhodanese-like domain-containing protein [Isachenkonia alkalipeptolytica]|uniref:Rhodanese-like domain-containing protein n=1 Tax=Isachenkonia alkalipeptolytica TaxID=2565777 RepID=A0AA43XQ36_9CLOT|nr:rhodanese-like domain-containing protein [Isachenkonia alkalipeptolytica]NBG89630.1 rhodanese-like domain-containing protein [Isachenkonia alkalipeptolytica]
MNFKANKLVMLLMVLLLSLALMVGCGDDNGIDEGEEVQAENGEAVEEGDDEEEATEEDEEEAAEEESLDAAEVVWNATKPVMEGVADGNNILGFEEGLEQLEENPDDYFVIDMRRGEDYEEGHLPGAVHVSYDQLAQAMDSVPQDKEILIYCYTGQTSGQAVAAYQAMGFDALSLGGGMNFGWAPLELSEDTLETEANELPEATADWTAEEEVLQVEFHKHFNQGTNYIVQPEELEEAMGDDIMILDIRNQDAFDEGHIEGAEFMPWADMAANFDEIPTDKPVYVTCFSGQTAGQAIFNLRVNGIEAYSLYRGMAGWNGEDMPVVSN